MNIRITSNKAGDAAGAKKKTKTQTTSGPSFADVLAETGTASALETPESIAGGAGTGTTTQAPTYIPLDVDDIPKEPKPHATYLMEQLEILEQDILTGSPTQAVENLKRALELSPLDHANLSTKQKEILDQLHLRAAVEAAKMETGDR